MGLAEKLPSERRFALISVFLVANAIIYYFLAARTLEEIINKLNGSYQETFLIWSVHFGTLAVSFIAGAMLVNKVGRRRLFAFWTLIGVASPFALLAIDFAQTPITLLIAILFGVSTGLGIPNCMEYFTRSTRTENRGRYGGLIVLASGLGLFLLGMIGVEGIEPRASILIFWRLSSLLVLLIAKPLREYNQSKRNVSFGSIFRQRSFILYIVPWLMFSLVNYLSVPVQLAILGESTIAFLAIIENAIMGLFAVVAGHLIDYIGRKQATIAGFVLLGLSYAILGLFHAEPISWYLYTVLDGITWGILIVVFVISIWGDLSQNAQSDKYYAIGIMPFFISKYLQLVLGNDVAISISPYALFSFIALFLFLAVLPLVYAPETLSEKIMKTRELQIYVKKALDKAQKEDKSGKTETEHSQKEILETNEKSDENEKEYEEASKLAEKYY